MNFLELATAWAAVGVPVFPLQPGTKRPLAGSNGFKDASLDPEQIAAWAAANPEYGVGLHLEGAQPEPLFALDIDVKGDKNGFDSLFDLEMEHGPLPDTYFQDTPSGGRHFLFRGKARSSVETLGRGLDVRGLGGYIAAYQLPNDADFARWNLPVHDVQVNRLETAATEDLDLEVNIQRAVEYLKREPEGHIGGGSDNQAYKIASQMLDYGLSENKAAEVMIEFWGERSGFDEEWIVRKVENAVKHKQNASGSKAQKPASDIFAGINTSQPEKSEEQKRRKFILYDRKELRTLPDASWLLHGWIPDRGTGLFYGRWGSFKTFAAIDTAVSLAAQGNCVVYAAGEGGHGIRKRFEAAYRQRGMEDSASPPLYVVNTVPQASPDDVQALVDAIDARKIKPDLIILDTMHRMMAGKDENDTRDIGLVMQAMEALSRVYDPCFTMAIHHEGKDEARGARGSSAIPAGMDVVLKTKADEDAKILTLSAEKMKDAERPKPQHYRLKEAFGSLVLDPITEKDAQEATRKENDLPNKLIGATLKAMNVLRAENRTVNTSVLAAELCRDLDGSQSTIARRLHDRAIKGEYASFVEIDHTDSKVNLRWSFPQLDSE